MTVVEKIKKSGLFRRKTDDKLKEGEIMRLSIKRVNEEKYNVKLEAKGDREVMCSVLCNILAERFDMVCIPKSAVLMGVCVCNNPEDIKEDNDKSADQVLAQVNEGE